MKVGDFVEWCDQRNYPGLCGIITKAGGPVGIACASPEIFVHWLNFPKDYQVGEGWEKIKDVKLLSAGDQWEPLPEGHTPDPRGETQ
jgi:enhancing lycopene biosynthesis protein 2